MKQVCELIETMSQREKAYFTTLHKGNTDKLYFQIYKQVEKSKQSADAIRESFLTKKNSKARLNVEVNYLYKHLLRSLHIYRLNSKKPAQNLLKQLQFVHILLEKNLDTYAFKILRSVKKQAQEFEEYAILNNIIGLEEDLCFSSIDSNLPKKLRTLFEERISCIRLIEELNHLKSIKMQIIDLQYKGGLYIDKDDPRIEILQDPILYKKTKASKKIQDMRLFIKSVGFLLTGDYLQSEKEMGKRIKFIKSNLLLFSQSELYKAINNYLFLCSFTKDLNAFSTKIKELKSYKKEMELPTVMISYQEYYTSLRMFSVLRNKQELNKLIPKITKGLDSFLLNLNSTQKDEMYFHLIYAHIVLEKFDKAHQYLNQWITSGYEQFSFQIVKLFRLIIFFHQNEYFLLENELKNTEQIFRKKKQINVVYKCLFTFFKKASQKNKFNPNAIIQLQQKLQTLKADKGTKKYFMDFDFSEWALTI